MNMRANGEHGYSSNIPNTNKKEKEMPEATKKTKEASKLEEILCTLQNQRRTLAEFLARMEKMYTELHGSNDPYDNTKEAEAQEEPQGVYNALRSEIDTIGSTISNISTALTSLEENL